MKKAWKNEKAWKIEKTQKTKKTQKIINKVKRSHNPLFKGGRPERTLKILENDENKDKSTK